MISYLPYLPKLVSESSASSSSVSNVSCILVLLCRLTFLLTVVFIEIKQLTSFFVVYIGGNGIRCYLLSVLKIY